MRRLIYTVRPWKIPTNAVGFKVSQVLASFRYFKVFLFFCYWRQTWVPMLSNSDQWLPTAIKLLRCGTNGHHSWSLITTVAKPICDESHTNWRPLGDQQNLWVTKSVAASLLCMLKRLLATDLVSWPLGDLVATSIEPFRDLCNFFAIVSCFLVAMRLHHGCIVRVTWV